MPLEAGGYPIYPDETDYREPPEGANDMSKTLTLFKVVRDDGFDCYTGRSVRYEVGETFEVSAAPAEHGECAEGLHGCYKPEGTLLFRNGQWPVRLLKLTADESDVVVRGDSKARCRKVAVTEELPIHVAFGTNGEAVLTFINSLKTWKWLQSDRSQDRAAITSAQEHMRRLSVYGFKPVERVEIKEMTMAAAWDAARAAARDAAWSAAWAAARDAARAAARAAARDAARDAAWSAARAAARAAAWDAARAAARDAAWSAEWAAARDAAWSAARDAACGAARAAARDAARDTAWSVAWAAARDAEYRVVADLMPDKPNLFEPLSAIWCMGFYPIGPVDGVFVIASIVK
jgi:hypothetical protein